MKRFCNFFLLLLIAGIFLHGEYAFPQSESGLTATATVSTPLRLKVGAERMDEYLPDIQKTNIAIVANQTSIVGQTHLIDTLFNLGIRIKCLFAPEHGLRGQAGAGEEIRNSVDLKTGLPVISLYGKHCKPSEKDLTGVGIVLFDIQDVGARFYTYISTLQYVMEACAEHHVQLIVLDRPNPNGYYIDGPVLDPKFRSFVGMNKIPVVHGLTIGEYAQMLNGEKWLRRKLQCPLKVVKVFGYTHRDFYQLPVPPSPNLPNMTAVYLYPSLCLFEGTRVSVGRGTTLPFQWIGYPGFKEGDQAMTPRSITGVVKNPPYEDTLCNGIQVKAQDVSGRYPPNHFRLDWLIRMYRAYGKKDHFFNSFFDTLCGTDRLRIMLQNSLSEEFIRESWKPALDKYKVMRKKYLLYTDFE